MTETSPHSWWVGTEVAVPFGTGYRLAVLSKEALPHHTHVHIITWNVSKQKWSRSRRVHRGFTEHPDAMVDGRFRLTISGPERERARAALMRDYAIQWRALS